MASVPVHPLVAPRNGLNIVPYRFDEWAGKASMINFPSPKNEKFFDECIIDMPKVR